jgi:two-component sensor histidine kinase
MKGFRGKIIRSPIGPPLSRSQANHSSITLRKLKQCSGLIINELLSNAVKYAFADDRHGEIGITFKQDQGEFILIIEDEGIIAMDIRSQSEGFGYNVVATVSCN